MTETERFVQRLVALQQGELSRLRRHFGRPMDETLQGFDLFTGLWWPLRQESQRAPRRDTSWLVAKLYGETPLPHTRQEGGLAATLAQVLGQREPPEVPGLANDRARYRSRFDALLRAPLSAVEQHLRWALSVAARAVREGDCAGLDWARLLDDLSAWDRGGSSLDEQPRTGRDVSDVWAEEYLNAIRRPKGR